MAYFLGIDAGGSKTALCLIAGGGGKVSRATGGPANLLQRDDATLQATLSQALDAVCRAASHDLDRTSIAAVCAGAAGASSERRSLALQQLISRMLPRADVSIVPDYVIALAGAADGEPGIVIVAGTGAVAFGRSAAGETRREDGLGYLLGDLGSGFDLGRRLLTHALDKLAADEEDAITRSVLEQTGSAGMGQILEWVYDRFEPARIAALAPIAGTLADNGDDAAMEQVSATALRLRRSVRRVRVRLSMPADVAVYRQGSLWKLGTFFRSEFESPVYRLSGDTGHLPGYDEELNEPFNIVEPKYDAAYGAAMMALKTQLA